MNINYKESQIDFFSQPSGKPAVSAPARYLDVQVSLSLENLVILSIAAIMVVIFSFSLGIERGKRIVLAPPAEGAADANVSVAASKVTEKIDKASVKNDVKNQPVDAQRKPSWGSVRSVAKGAGSADNQGAAVIVADKAPSSGVYTIQVASYKTEKPARIEADRLKAKGFHDVYVMPKGTYTIVCVGNFQKKEDASGLKRQLKSRYQDFVVRRL